MQKKPDICFQQAQREFPPPTRPLEEPQWLSHRLVDQAQMCSVWSPFLEAVDAGPDVVEASMLRICLCNATFDTELVGCSVHVFQVAVADLQRYVAL